MLHKHYILLIFSLALGNGFVDRVWWHANIQQCGKREISVSIYRLAPSQRRDFQIRWIGHRKMCIWKNGQTINMHRITSINPIVVICPSHATRHMGYGSGVIVLMFYVGLMCDLHMKFDEAELLVRLTWCALCSLLCAMCCALCTVDCIIVG